MIVLDFPPFRGVSTLPRSFARDLAGAHDVFARDRTVRMNLLYVLGVTILTGVLNLLFRNTPAMPTGIHLVVALLVYPLLWGPAFVARHTQGRKLTEYGFGLNMKAFVGAASFPSRNHLHMVDADTRSIWYASSSMSTVFAITPPHFLPSPLYYPLAPFVSFDIAWRGLCEPSSDERECHHHIGATIFSIIQIA